MCPLTLQVLVEYASSVHSITMPSRAAFSRTERANCPYGHWLIVCLVFAPNRTPSGYRVHPPPRYG
jgi:hypothetical protein